MSGRERLQGSSKIYVLARGRGARFSILPGSSRTFSLLFAGRALQVGLRLAVMSDLPDGESGGEAEPTGESFRDFVVVTSEVTLILDTG